ncbi:hypothetical protein [Xanthobacter sp. 126]|uniref:hypothetical protein n=1 Tax=Xanthobacter sp. 126 TaxID=1131814 RepID=UPI00045EA77B|nr:hypothetical protein [Xanthobacter sp. 126]
MALLRYSADDREAFADPHGRTRVREQIEHLQAVLDRMNELMDRAISDGQRLIWDAHYAGADFGGNGPGQDLRAFRESVEAAFEDALGTVRASIRDRRDELEAQ